MRDRAGPFVARSSTRAGTEGQRLSYMLACQIGEITSMAHAVPGAKSGRQALLRSGSPV
jgi:hypothetical protein